MNFREFLANPNIVDKSYIPNPQNTINQKPLINESYEYVKDLLYTIDNEKTDKNTIIISLCIERIKNRPEIYDMNIEIILDYMAYFNSEIIEIFEMERALQTVVPRPSIDNFVSQIGFEGFSYFPQLYDLTEGDVTKYYDVLKMPYNICYQYLIYKSKLNDLQFLLQNVKPN